MIFFIAAAIIAGSVAAALFINTQSVVDSVSIASKTLSGQLKTDVTIINDPEKIPRSGDVYTFYVKNTGKRILPTEYVNVIIDGTIIPEADMTKTIVGGGSTWGSGDVLQIDVTYTGLSSGDHTIRVITENGIDDSMDFKT
ncbi:Archaebacterial flagellin [Candidatus Methanoperedenaceae archaeon GB50]|nr:Archaebacterial flagellin [Candidatus Methanoperedenaceae archaeon GB37]CAD7770205.1 Archaebacterial flagellin [Candidatus Methanoperedenaceae archaeon GB50]